MTGRGPSETARRVAVHRLSFERLAAPYGDPAADEALTRDVAGGAGAGEAMARYLGGRTAFFDRVVVNAISRGVTQVVVLGAGYDGRTLRYGKDGVRWWEVDLPATQADKRGRLRRLGIAAEAATFVAHDLEQEGLAAALVGAGFVPDGMSLFLCEGVLVYLSPAGVERVLDEARSLAAPSTRLAASMSVATDPQVVERRARFSAAVAALGEPALNGLDAQQAGDLFARSRWRLVGTSERSSRAGFVVLAPQWAPPTPGGRPSLGVVACYMDSMLSRPDGASVARHLEAIYGVAVTGHRELDLGVHRVARADGSQWIARAFPPARPLEQVRGDAAVLEWLAAAGVPAERCASSEAVSQLDGHAVLVTQLAPGRPLRGTPAASRFLGDLLGRLHTLPLDPVSGAPPAAARPGGAWHHLASDAVPADEIAEAGRLLAAARERVPPAGDADPEQLGAALAELVAGLDGLDDCSDLPHAFVHPDLVARNALAATDGSVTVIDWAGAGRGPRVLSLGCLLWAAGQGGRRALEEAVVAYRRRLGDRLAEEELERLEVAMQLRPFVLAAWSVVTGRRNATGGAAWWAEQRDAIEPMARLAQAAFRSEMG